MTVRTCEQAGLPGYQSRPAEGPPGPCHTYQPDDQQSRAAALRAAARDAVTAADAQAGPAAP